MDRKVIIWVGDGGCKTGFARVNESIINNLPEDKYEIHHLAINYRGDPYPDSKASLYPAMLGGDLYGFGRLPSMIEKFKPDLIFILNDIWVTFQYMQFIPEDIKIVTYFPVDAKPLHSDWVAPIAERAAMVAYTKFGRDVVRTACPETPVKVIPHGIDTDIFYPIDMAEARTSMSGLKTDDFIVLNANRNQPRKRIDLTIKGFAKFVEDKPDNVKLYCHMGVEDMGWHVIKMCERYNIVDRLVLTSLDLSPASYISDERLNLIYNACDIGINSSGGEGWGLTTFEHGACKRAQITVDSSASSELYKGRAYLMPVDHYETYPQILTEGAMTSVDSVVEALEYYYTHPEERKSDAEKIYEFITQQKFQWKAIGRQWSDFFDKVLE